MYPKENISRAKPPLLKCGIAETPAVWYSIHNKSAFEFFLEVTICPEEIYKKVRELCCTGRREDAAALCWEGLAEFPDVYILMEELAFNLSYSSDKAVLEECIALFERIRAGSNDEIARNVAVGNLCQLYMQVGKPDDAKRLAESVPVLIYSRENCKLSTLRGAEWENEMRHEITRRFNRFVWDIPHLISASADGKAIYTNEEMLELWRKVIVFVETFYKNGDYAFDRQLLVMAYFNRAILYAGLGQTETALDELETMLAHIEEYVYYSIKTAGKTILRFLFFSLVIPQFLPVRSVLPCGQRSPLPHSAGTCRSRRTCRRPSRCRFRLRRARTLRLSGSCRLLHR